MEELNRLDDEQKKYVHFEKTELADAFNMLLEGNQIAEKYLEIFEYFGYCKNGAACVPVYDEHTGKVVDKMYEAVLKKIEPILIKALTKMKEADQLPAVL